MGIDGNTYGNASGIIGSPQREFIFKIKTYC